MSSLYQPIPRINGRQIPQYEGHQVCLVGRVLQSNDQFTLLEASDRQQVRIHNQSGRGALPQQSIAEFCGLAGKDGSLQETGRTEFAETFNLENYHEMLQLMHAPELRSLFA